MQPGLGQSASIWMKKEPGLCPDLPAPATRLLGDSLKKLCGPVNWRWVSLSHIYTYTVSMKNITLAVDEKVLAVVRRYSAEHNCSVNSLVREYLTDIAEREDKAKQARKNIQILSAQSTAKRGSRTWSRDSLHER